MSGQIAKSVSPLVPSKRTRRNLQSQNSTTRQLAIFAGAIVLIVLAAFTWLYCYAISAVNSAVSTFKP
ncbi:MAG TPA: hypothetical protein VFW94_07265 [Candidatus Acidoferrales bacterium]|nr:hypothetical protein [Candidatus Acidoferrales bacterium]